MRLEDGVSEAARGAGWSWVLKLGLSVALLGWLLRLVDIPAIARALRTTNLTWVGVGVGLYLASQMLSAAKWHVLAVGAGLERPLSRVVAYYFIGMFFNAFGFGTVGGDVMRAIYLAGGKDRARALSSVLVDRLTGLGVLLAISVGALIAFRGYELPAALYWSTLILAVALFVGWWAAPFVLPALLPRAGRLRRRIEDELSPYWRDYPLLLKASLISFVFHVAQILVVVVFAHALGLEIPGTFFLIFAPLVNLGAALPISWNGLGVRESAYVFFLGQVGVRSESAVALALLWLGAVLAGGAVGGVIYVSLRETSVEENRP